MIAFVLFEVCCFCELLAQVDYNFADNNLKSKNYVSLSKRKND